MSENTTLFVITIRIIENMNFKPHVCNNNFYNEMGLFYFCATSKLVLSGLSRIMIISNLLGFVSLKYHFLLLCAVYELIIRAGNQYFMSQVKTN